MAGKVIHFTSCFDGDVVFSIFRTPKATFHVVSRTSGFCAYFSLEKSLCCCKISPMEDKGNCPKKRSIMVWSQEKELILLKEVAAEGVLTHKQRSRERGAQWQKVANNINSLGDEITSRSARDHYNMLTRKYRARMALEERSTGEGGGELTEYESLLEELIEIEDATDQQMESEDEAKKQRIEREKGQALEMRERAMERFGQTKKRIGGTSESTGEQVRKRRRSGDMVEWLQERIELEKEEKELEQVKKTEDMEAQKVQHLEMLQVMQQTQQQFGMQMKLSEQYLQQQMQQQQEQQQQQQQQFAFLQQQMMAVMQQQQQQTQVLANMFKKKD